MKEPNQKKLIALPVKALDFKRSNNQGSPVAKYSRALHRLFWQRAAGGKARPSATMIWIGNQAVSSRWRCGPSCARTMTDRAAASAPCSPASLGRSLQPSLDGYGLRLVTGTHEEPRAGTAPRSHMSNQPPRVSPGHLATVGSSPSGVPQAEHRWVYNPSLSPVPDRQL